LVLGISTQHHGAWLGLAPAKLPGTVSLLPQAGQQKVVGISAICLTRAREENRSRTSIIQKC
jgi:hypothetical protein